MSDETPEVPLPLDDDPVPLSFFWWMLASVLAIFVLQAGFDDTQWMRVLVVGVQGAAMMLALRAARAPHRFRLIGAAIVALSLGSALLGVVLEDDFGEVLSTSIPTGLLAALTLVALVAAVRSEGTVSMRTVLAAVTIYIFIGLFFANIYRAINTKDADAFQTSAGVIDLSTLQYFSFIALTTVGFGDVTAISRLPRALVSFQALLGQLYLVTVVALVVGNIGRERLVRRRRPKQTT